MVPSGVCGAPTADDALACPSGEAREIVAPAWQIARLRDRLAATILDSVLLLSVFVLTGMAAVAKGRIVLESLSLTSVRSFEYIASALAVSLSYFWICEGLFGATLGKALAGIQVRKEGGSRCGLGPSLVRNLLRVVDGLGLYLFGFIVALFSNLRQRLGDQAAGTIVVKHKFSRMARAGLILFWLELLGSGLGVAFLLHRFAPEPESPTIVVRRADLPTGGETITPQFLESNGAPRAALPYRPGDTVNVSYDITGYAAGAEGRPRLLANVLVFDPDGLPLHQPWSDTLTAQAAPGSPVHGVFSITLAPYVPPGTYKVAIWARDYQNSRDLQASRTFQVEASAAAPPQSLELRDFALSLLPDGEPRVLPVLRGPGAVYMRCKLFGMKFNGDRVTGRIGLRVIGPGGSIVFDQPHYVDIRADVVYHPVSLWLPVHGDLKVPARLQPGTYTELYTVTDNVAGRSIVRQARFQVR
jgi:uncharacterized RDD family membrane protein YckC